MTEPQKRPNDGLLPLIALLSVVGLAPAGLVADHADRPPARRGSAAEPDRARGHRAGPTHRGLARSSGARPVRACSWWSWPSSRCWCCGAAPAAARAAPAPIGRPATCRARAEMVGLTPSQVRDLRASAAPRRRRATTQPARRAARRDAAEPHPAADVVGGHRGRDRRPPRRQDDQQRRPGHRRLQRPGQDLAATRPTPMTRPARSARTAARCGCATRRTSSAPATRSAAAPAFWWNVLADVTRPGRGARAGADHDRHHRRRRRQTRRLLPPHGQGHAGQLRVRRSAGRQDPARRRRVAVRRAGHRSLHDPHRSRVRRGRRSRSRRCWPNPTGNATVCSAPRRAGCR